jgi:RimJ/RimL family protein N-acetyltransferase
MQEIITYLEMTSPDDLTPAPVIPTVSLVPATPEQTRSITIRIGTPYNWESATFTDDQWAEYISRTQSWMVTANNEPAGLVDYEITADTVEITTFGLVPEFVGKGIGAHALTLGLQRAWTLTPTVRRVWLHTSTQDHPNALSNYRKRGLRPFKTKPGKSAPSAS